MTYTTELGFKLETIINGIKYLDSEDFLKLMEIAIELNPIKARDKKSRLKDAEELRRRGYIKVKSSEIKLGE